jgi:HK97 family phage prohead protease
VSVTVEAIRSDGPPWIRQAEFVNVSFPDRTIELIVIPYEREIEVPHPTKRGGPRVIETICRSAFDGIQRRARRVKAYRSHDETGLFGRAASFHPSDPAGLRAKVSIARTPLGDETLELADLGCLEASAGFWPSPNVQEGIEWQDPGRYRVLKAFLRHIALVPEGAYGDAAGVLAVRAAEPPAPTTRGTPNRDALELELLRERYAAIDARYLR